MGVGASLNMYDVVVKSSRSLSHLMISSCYRQHRAQRHAPVFKLLGGRFWGFSPRRGDTLHRWGLNLAWTRGPDFDRRSPSPCQISPPSVQR